MKKIAMGIALLISSAGASAQGFDVNQMYFGGGLNYNSLSGWDSR